MFAAKPDGSLRVYADYVQAPECTEQEAAHAFPNINDLYDMLQGARYFTNLDHTSGYHQIRIAPDDCEKPSRCLWACFSTECYHLGSAMPQVPFRLFRYYELCSAKYIGQFVLVYMEDIVICSSSAEEHVLHVRLVLERFRQNQLFVKRKKCKFMRSELKFLGLIVSDERIKVDSAKVVAVQDWSRPRNVCDVRAFVGLCT